MTPEIFLVFTLHPSYGAIDTQVTRSGLVGSNDLDYFFDMNHLAETPQGQHLNYTLSW